MRKNRVTFLASLLAFFIYAYLWLFPLFAPQFLDIWLTVIALKLILEFVTLTLAARIFRQTFPVFQIFYTIYIVFFYGIGTSANLPMEKRRLNC